MKPLDILKEKLDIIGVKYKEEDGFLLVKRKTIPPDKEKDFMDIYVLTSKIKIL